MLAGCGSDEPKPGSWFLSTPTGQVPNHRRPGPHIPTIPMSEMVTERQDVRGRTRRRRHWPSTTGPRTQTRYQPSQSEPYTNRRLPVGGPRVGLTSANPPPPHRSVVSSTNDLVRHETTTTEEPPQSRIRTRPPHPTRIRRDHREKVGGAHRDRPQRLLRPVPRTRSRAIPRVGGRNPWRRWSHHSMKASGGTTSTGGPSGVADHQGTANLPDR